MEKWISLAILITYFALIVNNDYLKGRNSCERISYGIKYCKEKIVNPYFSQELWRRRSQIKPKFAIFDSTGISFASIAPLKARKFIFDIYFRSRFFVIFQTDIQTSSQRFQLTASTPQDTLSPDESQDEVLSYEVKELGTHM